MEANRDAAETCVVRAEAAQREQDFAKALRFLIKAKGLYPLDNLDATIRAVSAKVPAAADEELASTPVPPGDVGDALARKQAREEEGAEAGSKKPAATASESPTGTSAVAEVLARLSKAEARSIRTRAQAALSKAEVKCAQELHGLSRSHANSPAWASGGIAAVVRLGHDPASAADAVCALFNLSAVEANRAAIIEAGAIPPLVALLCGTPEDAAAKAAGALSNLANDEADKAVIIEAGAIPPLVALLGGGPESKAAEGAAAALRKLARDNAAIQATIIEGGAIPPLVALLSGGPESGATKQAAWALRNLASKPAGEAARALRNLACANAGRAAIIGAGAIPPLVALLSGGPAAVAAEWATGALRKLAHGDAGRAAVIEAGAIPPLVALLGGGPASKAAGSAAGILDRLASDTNTTAAVLKEVARTTADCSFCSSLHAKLRKSASKQLQAVVNEGTDAAALDHAIILARAVPLEKSVIDHAAERLREVYADTERQKRRESFGLGSLALPNEFMCPLTLDKMRDPVVASDGFSYERSAILSVINSTGVSPLTRKRLRPNVLVPNLNLKKRILEFEGNVLDAVDNVSKRRDETELAEEITQRDAARGVAAELHDQLEQKKESHARELRSLREELKELSGTKRALEADAGMAGGAAAAEGAEGAEAASGGAAGDERRQGGSRKKRRI